MLKFKATSSLFIKMMKDCFHKHTHVHAHKPKRKSSSSTRRPLDEHCAGQTFSLHAIPQTCGRLNLKKFIRLSRRSFPFRPLTVLTSLECGRLKFFDGLCMKSILWIPYERKRLKHSDQFSSPAVDSHGYQVTPMGRPRRSLLI